MKKASVSEIGHFEFFGVLLVAFVGVDVEVGDEYEKEVGNEGLDHAEEFSVGNVIRGRKFDECVYYVAVWEIICEE